MFKVRIIECFADFICLKIFYLLSSVPPVTKSNAQPVTRLPTRRSVQPLTKRFVGQKKFQHHFLFYFSRFVPLAMADTVDMESNVRKFPRRAVSKSQFRSLWASVNRSQKNLVHRWVLTWSTSFFVYFHTFLLGPSPETCSELSADSKRELQADPSAELSPDSC